MTAPTLLLSARDCPADAIPVRCVASDGLDAWKAKLPPHQLAWLETVRFRGRAGEIALIPADDRGLDAVVLGTGESDDPFVVAALANALPDGAYRLESSAARHAELDAIAWCLGHYRFARYLAKKEDEPARDVRLCVGDVDTERVGSIVDATALVRDLVNTPPNDMGPDQLEAAVGALAERHGAKLVVTAGDDLLAANHPMIHAVGRASTRTPRLIDLTWGDDEAPRLTLVGKGVCFDTGGLDIKPAPFMRNMKKDMGGAAHVMGLASLVMDAALPVRLRVLVPAVENSVSGNAYRPGDVLPSRKGISVEIGNTDAEGRLVLADALALADEEAPDLLIDMATLTGAARIALGPDLAPFYTDDEPLAAGLIEHAEQVRDPVWRMPLWKAYSESLDSKVADINHISDVAQGGSITAALFLSKFVDQAESWVHFDVYAWNDKPRPGRPAGGEAQGLRALFSYLQSRFG